MLKFYIPESNPFRFKTGISSVSVSGDDMVYNISNNAILIRKEQIPLTEFYQEMIN